MADNKSINSIMEKPTSTTKSHENHSDKSRHRKRHDRERSSSVKRHRHKRSKSRSHSRHKRSKSRSHSRHKRSKSRSRSRSRHHRSKHHRHSRSPRRKRHSRSHSPRRRPSPVPIRIEPRMTEDDKKRMQLETLQKLREMAANDTLDLSRLSIEDLKKAIDVPKEFRSNQATMVSYQMEEIRKLIEEFTGITIPKIYNSGAINPLQFAQQQRKRKLLWSKTNDKTSTSKVGAAITDGQDEKTAEKFRKLLGMKGTGDTSESTAIQQQQQNTFDSLDKEYQTARITTHLRRGVGLGFGSQGPFLPSSSSTEKN